MTGDETGIEYGGRPLSDREVKVYSALVEGVGGLALAAAMCAVWLRYAPTASADSPMLYVGYMSGYFFGFNFLLGNSLDRLETAADRSTSPPAILGWLA